MKIYTAHLRPRAAPVLVKDGFSWGALLFGCLWLFAWRAWIPAILALAAGVLIGALATDGARIALEFALAVLLGLIGRDLVGWSLARRGYTLVHIVAARDGDAALARLLTARPDLAAGFLPPGTAR